MKHDASQGPTETGRLRWSRLTGLAATLLLGLIGMGADEILAEIRGAEDVDDLLQT